MKSTSFLMTLVLIAALIGIGWTIPYVVAALSCYDSSVAAMDDVTVRSRSQFWDDRKICTMQFEAISSIGICFERVKEKDSPLGFGQKTTDFLIPLIRPKIKTVDMLIADHNDICSSYQDLQFEQNK